MNAPAQPSPDLFFDTITAYQKSAALKAALDLDIFTALSHGPASSADLAGRCKADSRGIRILCDYMTILGFLKKTGTQYELTLDSRIFLNRQSPGFAGGAADFLLSDPLISAFRNLTESVRKGSTVEPEQGSVSAEHPMWITFARAMGGIMMKPADGLADLLPLNPDGITKVLDVAAGHGIWGIAFARKYPQAQVVALDWAPVLEVARENARAVGVADRFSTIAGSAFDVDIGADYEVILVPNFLHHFSADECVRFLKKCHAALRPGGRIAIAEFVPNPDRVTPPQAAGFSIIMLASTPAGDAYTGDEYAEMLSQAGFQKPAVHGLPASMNQALIAAR